MNDPHYEAWRKARSDVSPPADFTDRVMSHVRRTRVAVKPRRAGADPATRLFSRRYLAAALVVLAVCLGVLRLVSVVAMILATPSGGF
jgi:hypothetical protein